MSELVRESRIIKKLLLTTQFRMIRQHMKSQKFMDLCAAKGIDIEKVLRSKNNREFDINYAVPDLKLKDVSQYYDMLTAHDKVDRIRVPTLSINSMDDIMIPSTNVPIADIMQNPNIIQLMVAGGGHIEYFHGLSREFVGVCNPSGHI